jgi:hypothetical protein
MPVLFAMFFGLFGIVSALVGFFAFNIGFLAAFGTYLIVGGVMPFALIALNVAEDGTDFVERRAQPRGMSI